MGAPVVQQFGHGDIDPTSIKMVSFNHGDIDPTSISAPDQPDSEEKNEPSMLSRISKGIDSVTDAPVRSAIYASQNGQSPWAAFKNQFANTDSDAPSGEDIAAKAGISTQRKLVSTADQQKQFDQLHNPGLVGAKNYQDEYQFSPAQIAGQGIEFASNPLNLAGPALKVVGKLGEAAGPLAETLNSLATERALKAAGAMKRDFNIIHAKGTQDALGNFLLDNKIVTPLSTLSKVADRISEAKETAGQTIGKILDTADSAKAPLISAKDIALKLTEDPEIKNLASVPGQEGTANQINKFIQTLYNHPQGDSLSLRDAQELRQGIDKSINFNKRVPEMAGAQPYLFKMRDAISNAMNDSVNALPDGGDLNRLKTANAAYSKLATLDKIAQNRLGAASSNEQFSLGDKVATGVGAAVGHGNPVVAFSVGALNKASRTVGNSMAASGANAASKALTNGPEFISSLPNSVGPASSIVNGTMTPSVAALPAANNQSPSKGPDKWANDGFQNLKQHSTDEDKALLDKYKGAIMFNPKAKNLLVTASNFSAGSKPLDDIMKHLKNIVEKGKN